MISYQYTVNVSLLPLPASPAHLDAAVAALRAVWPLSCEVKWARMIVVCNSADIRQFQDLIDAHYRREMPRDIVGAAGWEMASLFAQDPVWRIGPNGLHQISFPMDYRTNPAQPFQAWQVGYNAGGPRVAPIWMTGGFTCTTVIS